MNTLGNIPASVTRRVQGRKNKKGMRILNLYACLGGNRYKWDKVTDCQVTYYVELDPEAARLYQGVPRTQLLWQTPTSTCVCIYKEFDFIWATTVPNT